MDLVRKIAENYRLPYYTMSPTYSVCKEHGYIQGEQFTCPHCGEKTEVYSRITGYYRPVQNWNDGKLQEYHDRLEYNIDEKTLAIDECDACKIDLEENKPSAEEKDFIYLIATKTCPNCKIATALLERANIDFEKIYVEDNIDLVKSFDVMQAQL
jgi:ribonucleoside-triphosphate reductase